MRMGTGPGMDDPRSGLGARPRGAERKPLPRAVVAAVGVPAVFAAAGLGLYVGYEHVGGGNSDPTPAVQLLSSRPASGSTDVPLDLGAVELTFDQDMVAETRPDRLLAGAADSPPLPVQTGAAARWLDARVVRIPIGPLLPGREYAFVLRSSWRGGFRARSGKAILPLTMIRFRTRREGSP